MTIIYQVIKKVVDEDKINKSIDSYEKDNGKRPQFLIMSTNTLNNFRELSYSKDSWDLWRESYPAYREIPIAVCNYIGEGQIAIV